MSTQLVTITLQVIVALGLLNVWLIRSHQFTQYRGSDAKNIREEFAAYGLPTWCLYAVGSLKIGAAILLLVGIWASGLVFPAAAVVAFLMVGAIAMHIKVKDPLKKAAPAMAMLAMSVGLSVMTFGL